jgi:IMP dehydrogenase
MVRRVQNHKAGFVVSDSNLPPSATLGQVLAITTATGHSTIAITEDGTPKGRLVGLITSRDYRPGKQPPSTPVRELMTPFASLTCAKVGLDLAAANDLIWAHKLNCLPVIDDAARLHYLVFRKDHDAHQVHPLENVDSEKRLIVGAGWQTLPVWQASLINRDARITSAVTVVGIAVAVLASVAITFWASRLRGEAAAGANEGH